MTLSSLINNRCIVVLLQCTDGRRKQIRNCESYCFQEGLLFYLIILSRHRLIQRLCTRLCLFQPDRRVVPILLLRVLDLFYFLITRCRGFLPELSSGCVFKLYLSIWYGTGLFFSHWKYTKFLPGIIVLPLTISFWT